MKKKVLITATVLSHIAQFHRPLAEILHEAGYEVHVAGKDNLALKNGLKIDWADKIFDVPFSRSPKSLDNVKAYHVLKDIISQDSYDFIHCNTPMGGIVTRLAARKAKNKSCEVIYTAHGFHFHKRASKLAWLFFYPIEKFFSKYTDKLITINHEDYLLASKNFSCPSFYIHGVGVNARRYIPLVNEDERLSLCHELDIPLNCKVILSVGELLPNKNQKMIINSMKQVVSQMPEALLIIAGNGPMREELESYVKKNDLGDHVRFIGYCTYLEKYQKIASILTACSYREGLPLNLVEAMLANNPIVATHNRGHDELIEDGKNGYLVEPDNYREMSDRIIMLLKDDNLRMKLAEKARQFALNYSSDNVKQELKAIYGI